MRTFKHTTKRTAGFTLIEMIVAVGIFSVVVTISTGAIFSIVSASRTAQSLKAVLDNLNGALDTMSRTIRFGDTYHCESVSDLSFDDSIQVSGVAITAPHSCINGGNVFVFEGYDGNPLISGDQIVYKYLKDTDATGAQLATGAIWRCYGGGTVGCVRLTAPEVYITDFRFFVWGAENDDRQPLLVMLIKGYSLEGTKKQEFQLETTVSQRNLDAYLQ